MATEIGGETYYTVEELAAKFAVSPATVYGYIREGKLAAARFGKRYQVAGSRVTDFLKKGTAVALVFSLLTGALGLEAPAALAQAFNGGAGRFQGGANFLPAGPTFMIEAYSFRHWAANEGKGFFGESSLAGRLLMADLPQADLNLLLGPLKGKMKIGEIEDFLRVRELSKEERRRLGAGLERAAAEAAAEIAAAADSVASKEALQKLESTEDASTLAHQLQVLSVYGAGIAKKKEAVVERLSELRIEDAKRDVKKLIERVGETPVDWMRAAEQRALKRPHVDDFPGIEDTPGGRVFASHLRQGYPQQSEPAKQADGDLPTPSGGRSVNEPVDADKLAKALGAGVEFPMPTRGESAYKPEAEQPSWLSRKVSRALGWWDARESQRIHKEAFKVYQVNAIAAAKDEAELWKTADLALDGISARTEQIERALKKDDVDAANDWIADAEHHLAAFEAQMAKARERIRPVHADLSRYAEQYWTADSDMRGGSSYVNGAPKYSVLRTVSGDEAGAAKLKSRIAALKERAADPFHGRKVNSLTFVSTLLKKAGIRIGAFVLAAGLMFPDVAVAAEATGWAAASTFTKSVIAISAVGAGTALVFLVGSALDLARAYRVDARGTRNRFLGWLAAAAAGSLLFPDIALAASEAYGQSPDVFLTPITFALAFYPILKGTAKPLSYLGIAFAFINPALGLVFAAMGLLDSATSPAKKRRK